MCIRKIRGMADKNGGRGENDPDKQEKGRGGGENRHVPKMGRKERVRKNGERKKIYKGLTANRKQQQGWEEEKRR